MSDIESLKRELTYLYERNAIRNRELDALHMVWCNGPCIRGIHRYYEEKITGEELRELIRIGERNLDRMRTKLYSVEYRETNK